MKRFAILVPLGAVMASCGQGGPSYLPLVDEKEWSYTVSSAFQNNVVNLKVGKKISVGGIEGRTLTGELGESRVAWDKHRLIASMLSNTIFVPPVPLLVDDKIPDKKKDREAAFVGVEEWTGTIEAFGKVRKARASLEQRPNTIQLLTGDESVVETVLKVQIEGSKDDVPLELRTCFARGKGIVRQEQRTNRMLIVQLEFFK